MDQAEKLRDLVRKGERQTNPGLKEAIKIYTIMSGKGGVGKTNITVNLAIALQRKGKRVLIIDADLGMANVDVILGVYPKHTIYDVLFKQYPLEDTVITSFEGVKILPGGSGMMELASLDIEQQEAFARQFLTFEDIDIILIDTGAGISKNSLSFIAFSQELILVTTPEPPALTDAYSVIKIMVQYKLDKNIKVIVNRCSDDISGEVIYQRLNSTSKTFLNKSLEKLGHILDDSRVAKSVMDQTPFLIQYPNCPASKCICRIADELLGCSSHGSRIYSIQQVYKRLLKVFG
ncbi:MAG TPA: MinD/ParA family protein [Clostridiales bacterium]|nr:MinD/ParA family protein [Clostridiales bacterium]